MLQECSPQTIVIAIDHSDDAAVSFRLISALFQHCIFEGQIDGPEAGQKSRTLLFLVIGSAT
jgi:hypothetical protein